MCMPVARRCHMAPYVRRDVCRCSVVCSMGLVSVYHCVVHDGYGCCCRGHCVEESTWCIHRDALASGHEHPVCCNFVTTYHCTCLHNLVGAYGWIAVLPGC